MITKKTLKNEIRDLKNKLFELYVEVDMLKDIVYKTKKTAKTTKATKTTKKKASK